MDIKEIRLENLLSILTESDVTQASLASACESAPSVISQLKTGHRDMGRGLARRIEKARNLPYGWMDTRHTYNHMRKPLSAKQAQWAANLYRVWLKKKKELNLTQKKAGDMLGWTQGAVGHYLNARTPLNTDAKVKFAKLLGIAITDIDPEFSKDILNSTQETASKDDPPNPLGMRIREARNETGLSQQSLAKLLNISSQAVTLWETGKTNPSTENLIALARSLNKPIDYFVIPVCDSTTKGATTIREIRYHNARLLQDSIGGQKAMIEITKKSQGQISAILGANPSKSIGNNLARELEQIFNKPSGWLDIWNNSATDLPADHYKTDRTRIDKIHLHQDHISLLRAIILKIENRKFTLTPDQKARLIAATFTSCVNHNITEGNALSAIIDSAEMSIK